MVAPQWRKRNAHESSVSDGLEMLLLDIIALNLYFLLEINETKRNDLWLNIKGNYMLFVGKILLNLY